MNRECGFCGQVVDGPKEIPPGCIFACEKCAAILQEAYKERQEGKP